MYASTSGKTNPAMVNPRLILSLTIVEETLDNIKFPSILENPAGKCLMG